MSWGDIPDLTGLEDEYVNPPITPPSRPTRTYDPDVEALRPTAERLLQPDEIEPWLQQKQQEADSKKLQTIRSTVGNFNTPETRQYLGINDQGDQNPIGKLRTERAAQGRTAVPDSEYARLAAISAGIAGVGAAFSPGVALGAEAGPGTALLEGAPALASGFGAATAVSQAIPAIPGFESLPRPIRSGIQLAPYFTGPEGVTTKLGEIALTEEAGRMARDNASTFGVSPDIAEMGGQALGGFSASGYRKIFGEEGARALDVKAPGELYHFTPSKNVESIRKAGLNPGSWLSDSPEAAAAQARVLGNTGDGKILRFPVQEGQVDSATTTLSRSGAFKNKEPLVPTDVQDVPQVRTDAGKVGRGEFGGVGGQPEDDLDSQLSSMGVDARKEVNGFKINRISRFSGGARGQFSVMTPDSEIKSFRNAADAADFIRNNGTGDQDVMSRMLKAQQNARGGDINSMSYEELKAAAQNSRTDWNEVSSRLESAKAQGSDEQTLQDIRDKAFELRDRTKELETARDKARNAAKSGTIDQQGEPERVSWRDLMSGGETGAVKKGTKKAEEPLSDLEQQLKDSQALLEKDPEAAKRIFRGKAAAQAAETRANDAAKSDSFRQRYLDAQNKVKDVLKKAGDETGAIEPGPGYQESEQEGFKADLAKMSARLAQEYENGADADTVTSILKEMRATQRLMRGELNVPSQSLPPEQQSLFGGQAGQAPRLRGGQEVNLPTDQASFNSAPPHWQGPEPPPTTPEAWAEFLSATGKQPEFKDALTYHGTQPEPVTPEQWRNFLEATGTQPKLSDAATYYGVTPEAITPAQWGEYLKASGRQPAFENAMPELGQQAGELSPEKLAELYRGTGNQPGLDKSLTYPGAQIPEKSIQEVRDSLAQARFWGALEKHGITPDQFVGGGNRPPPDAVYPGTGPGGSGKPPKGPGQYTLSGSFEPAGGAASLGREIVRSIFDLPGQLISLKSSLTPPFLRQGKVRLVTAPRQALKEFGQSMSAIIQEARGNKEIVPKLDQAIKTDDWVRDGGPYKGFTYRDVGGTLLELGDTAEERQIGLGGKEGTAVSRFIRGRGFVKLSDRQAVLELNLHRTNWYKEVAQGMWDSGLRSEEDIPQYQQLRKNIEHWTQRGPGSQPANLPLFFSVRSQTGRALGIWDMLSGTAKGLASGDITQAGPHREAAKALVGMVTANMAEMAAYTALIGGAIEMKDGLPTLRDGSFHLDPWAGWGGQAKLAIGVAKDIQHVYNDALNSPGGWDNVPDDFASKIGGRFSHYAASQLSPFFSTLAATQSGRDFAGHPYSLGKEIKSGGLVLDWTSPIIVEELANAFREGGLGAVAKTAPGTFLSEGTGTYQTLGELRDDTAKKAGFSSYAKAGPLGQNAVNSDPAVVDYREKNPTAYQSALLENTQDSRTIQATKLAEDNFKSDIPNQKSLPEYWSDEGIARTQMSSDLQNQFAKQFTNFDKDKFEKAVEGYYNTQKTFPDNKEYDFEGTDAARQAYLKNLPPDQQQWVNEALQVTKDNKSPLHKEYLDYLDKKEQAGYFEPGLTGADRQHLDEENPSLDVQQWKFGSNIKGKAPPSLQSTDAVDEAMKVNPKQPIKFGNAARPVNDSEKSLEAWDAQGSIIQLYSNNGTPELRDAYAHKISSNALDYDELPAIVKTKVNGQIKDAIAKDSRVEAMLIWWGVREKPSNPAVTAQLKALMQEYGPLYSKPEDK